MHLKGASRVEESPAIGSPSVKKTLANFIRLGKQGLARVRLMIRRVVSAFCVVWVFGFFLLFFVFIAFI